MRNAAAARVIEVEPVELVAVKHVVYFVAAPKGWRVATLMQAAPSQPGAIELESKLEADRIAAKLNGARALQVAS